MIIIRNLLDYASLGLTTFFLAEPCIVPGESVSKPRPSLLWLYFTTREIRSVMYTGFAVRILLDMYGKSSKMLGLEPIHPFAISNRLVGWCSIALLSSATLLTWLPNLLSRRRTGQDPSERGSWRFTAWDSESYGLLGVWWLGMGNGEWFLFGGHNDPNSNSIIPAAFLDQMGSRKPQDQPEEPSEESRIVEVDENEFNGTPL